MGAITELKVTIEDSNLDQLEVIWFQGTFGRVGRHFVMTGRVLLASGGWGPGML